MYDCYVEMNANESGEHVVHSATCPSLPAKDKLEHIGVRSNTEAPLKEAANWFSKSTLCPECFKD